MERHQFVRTEMTNKTKPFTKKQREKSFKIFPFLHSAATGPRTHKNITLSSGGKQCDDRFRNVYKSANQSDEQCSLAVTQKKPNNHPAI
jgi:hypothetical protein